MPRLIPTVFLLVAGLCASCKPKPAPVTTTEPPLPPPVSYTHEVRPILANKCLHCHGSLVTGNDSGIRLDTAGFATTIRSVSGAAPIVPGDPANSSLLQKLFVADSDNKQRTDPAHTVTEEEFILLKNWIANDAPYEPHWAFQPLPAEVPVPTTNSSWPRNPIDHFVLDQLKGQEPRPTSSPSSWLNRTSLDLSGFPPSNEVALAFRQALEIPDNGETAMEQAVDTLLASPGFGEHLATMWLRSARYSDYLTPERTNGQWVYRNWVAKAFNEDLPYDQFIRNQLAGDLLPNPTREQVLATGFNRIHPLNPTAADPALESQFKRTETFARTILGLDLRCAKCHDHPCDPLTPDDYRGLASFFGNARETGRIPAPGVRAAPTLLLPTTRQTEELLTATHAEAKLGNDLRETITAGEESFRSWLGNPDKLPLISDLIGAYDFDSPGDTSVNQAIDGTGSAKHPAIPSTPGIRGQALRLDGRNPVSFPDAYPLLRSTPWTIAFWLQCPEVPQGPVTLLSSREPNGRGFELLLEQGRLAARLVREWPGNALGIRSINPDFTTATWHQITCSYDGSSSAAGLRIHLDGRLLDTTVTANHIWKELFTADPPPLKFHAHPDLRGSLLDDLQIFSRALTPVEIANLHHGNTLQTALEAGDLDRLRDYYFSSINFETRELQESLPSLRQKVVLAEKNIPREAGIMREPPSGSPGRSTPPFLPPLLSPKPDRLDLATWLVEPSHPLTARVFVNRIWANFFGQGLVESTGDLGLKSSAHRNPALLDWLARDFVKHGWNTKRLCRQIVLSSTYRQASQQTLDPISLRNRLISGSSSSRSIRGFQSPWMLPEPSDAPSLCPHSPTAPLPIPAPPPLSDQERLDIAAALADRVIVHRPNTDTARLSTLYLNLTGRHPATDELAALGGILREQTKLLEKEKVQPDAFNRMLWNRTCRIILDFPGIAQK